MRKYCIVLIFAVLSCTVQGAYESDVLKEYRVDSVMVTATNLNIVFNKEYGWSVDWETDCDIEMGSYKRFQYTSSSDYAEKNKALVLTADKKVWISDGHHVSVILIPVAFKNKLKGYKLATKLNFESFGDSRGTFTNKIKYVALSDTPIEVSAEDVEMVLEDDEWKTVDNEELLLYIMSSSTGISIRTIGRQSP